MRQYNTVVNVPLLEGIPPPASVRHGDRHPPALDAFAPELMVISAGFDAHRDDPIGGIRLEDADFAWAMAS